MEVQEILEAARDTMTVKRVYGEPIERDGMTLIPVARVAGGAGGGGPTEPGSAEARVEGEALEGTGAHRGRAVAGFGMGYGVMASPAGMYIIRGEQVEWKPAVDPQRMVLTLGLVAVPLLFLLRSMLRLFLGRAVA
jgi:uncharacterized spore protein YtfJ